jgi:hypothetical protein
MKIKELICKESYGNVKNISDYNQGLLVLMTNQMKDPQNLIPALFYKEWIKGKDSIVEKLSISLLKDYPVEVRCGYKPKQFFVTSLFSFDICDIIRDIWKCKIDFRENILLTYDWQKYKDLTFYVMMLTINKYKIETLYQEHIVFICIKVMITFFTLYKENQFLVHLDHVHYMVQSICETEISAFVAYAHALGFNYQDRPVKRMSRTLTKEEVMSFIKPDDSQTAIKEKIMKWCPCGERKARYIMQQYGLTKQKYSRKTTQ